MAETVDLNVIVASHSILRLPFRARTEQPISPENITFNTHVNVDFIASTNAIDHVPPSTNALQSVNGLAGKSVVMLAVTSIVPLRVPLVKNHVLGMFHSINAFGNL